MAKKRISKIAKSLKQIGEIQVNDWDFQAFLHKDIKDLEITRSLRRLGNLRVMEWDFGTAFPRVHEIAYREVDVRKILRRHSPHTVLERDFRNPSQAVVPAKEKAAEVEEAPDVLDMEVLMEKLGGFLRYVASRLIDEPQHARIHTSEIAPKVLCFRLVLTKRDMSMLIGTGGHTAAAIRSILKAVARSHGATALLQIQSHDGGAGGV